MNVAHLAPRRRDGVRDARRRRPAHGGHDVPDLPRPPRARGRRARRALPRLAGGDAVPPRGLRARASCSTPTSSPRARPAAARSSACRACATSTRAASARTSSSTTCSTSCCCRCPTTTRTRTSTARTPRSTSIAAADRQLERLMHAGGGPDAFLDEHAVIVVADHSHARVEQRDRPLAELFERLRASCRPAAPAPTTPRSRCARRSARRWSTCSSPSARAALLPRRRRAPRWRIDGVDLVMWRDDGEAVIARRGAASCASRPAARSRDARGERWRVDGDARRARRRVERRRAAHAATTRTRSRACGRRCAARRPATSCCPPAPGYEFVDWGGADHVGGGSHGSLHRSDSLGALLWCGVGPAGPQAPARSGRCATSRRWCARTSGCETPAARARWARAALRAWRGRRWRWSLRRAAARAPRGLDAAPARARRHRRPTRTRCVSRPDAGPRPRGPPPLGASRCWRSPIGEPKVREAPRDATPAPSRDVYLKGPARWQVSYLRATRAKPASARRSPRC